MLNELITNSLKHAFTDHAEGEISISVLSNNSEIILIFKDNGKGLPKNYDIEKPDTLGFTLVQALVDQMDGKFSISSDHGTLFNFSFPHSTRYIQSQVILLQTPLNYKLIHHDFITPDYLFSLFTKREYYIKLQGIHSHKEGS